VAGPELGDALRSCQSLKLRHGIASTVCWWNHGGEKSRAVANRYLAAMDALGKTDLNCYLSIKAPAIGFRHDLVAELTDRSRRGGVPLHFDALGPETADLNFDLIAAAVSRHPDVGCTLPGRWSRSTGDADRAVDLRLRARVVKGQWPDPEDPETDARAGFLAVVDRLAGRARHVAVATHDAPLAREAIQRLQAAGTPCEVELLFGLPNRRILRISRALGVPVRCYVPYGQGCLPAPLSDVRHDPRIAWWMMRALLNVEWTSRHPG
jgi:proline dehydrogenase